MRNSINNPELAYFIFPPAVTTAPICSRLLPPDYILDLWSIYTSCPRTHQDPGKGTPITCDLLLPYTSFSYHSYSPVSILEIILTLIGNP